MPLIIMTMKQILYNTITKQLSNEYPNGYPIAIPDHEQGYIFLLDVVEVEKPPIKQNEYLTPKEPVIDLDNKQYIKDWQINVRPEPTNEEIGEMRAARYREELRDLFESMIGYEVEGKPDLAAEYRQKWLDAKQEIRNKLPYHDE